MSSFPLDGCASQELAKEYVCGICTDICRHPVICPGDGCHLFCKSCIQQVLQQAHLRNECPVCQAPFPPSHHFEINKLASSKISALSTRCCHEQCDWRGTIGKLDQHLAHKCLFESHRARLACSNVGCSQVFSSNAALAAHLGVCPRDAFVPRQPHVARRHAVDLNLNFQFVVPPKYLFLMALLLLLVTTTPVVSLCFYAVNASCGFAVTTVGPAILWCSNTLVSLSLLAMSTAFRTVAYAVSWQPSSVQVYEIAAYFASWVPSLLEFMWCVVQWVASGVPSTLSLMWWLTCQLVVMLLTVLSYALSSALYASTVLLNAVSWLLIGTARNADGCLATPPGPL